MKTSPLVLGSGSWGSSLATLLSPSCHQVTIYGRDEKTLDEINTSHTNSKYLPNITLPDNILATADYQAATDANLILFVVPTSATRALAEKLSSLDISADTIFLSCSKGIERETGKRMSQVIADHFPKNPVAVLSGPNHAEEIAHGLPAAASIGCEDKATLEHLQTLFTSPRFRAYTCDDLAGMELGGAIKNVFAIAAGVAKGLKLGDNAIAALATRGLAEMIRLGTALGAKPETFTGLSGVGDLITTCFSEHSRNHRVGLLLGQGHTLQEAVQSLGMVAEGVPNTRSIYEASRHVNARTPLIDIVYGMLYEDIPSDQALYQLFARTPRHESENPLYT